MHEYQTTTASLQSKPAKQASKAVVMHCRCLTGLPAAQVPLNPDLLHQLEQPLLLPHLQAAGLRMCLHWLQDREALLKSELLALQSLPPACCESLRQQVSFSRCYHCYRSNLMAPYGLMALQAQATCHSSYCSTRTYRQMIQGVLQVRNYPVADKVAFTILAYN